MIDDKTLDPVDIFSTSIESLYGHQPITLASAGAVYTYTPQNASLKVTLITPDTLPANWSLHASDIWASSHYLADHIDDLSLHKCTPEGGKIHVLELGAAAGLPGILIAKTYDNVGVTVSDYPDELLIGTLSHNVRLNGVEGSCRAVAYAWGSDPAPLLREAGRGDGFDVIVAADTLWNPSLHTIFIETLRLTLRRVPMARIHLVAGLHTGRYTIQSFLTAVQEAGFEIESAVEKEVKGSRMRGWNVGVPGDEDDGERRRWVVWMILRWKVALVEGVQVRSN